MRRSSQLLGTAHILLTLSLQASIFADDSDTASRPLVTVNRHEITRADFDLACLVRGISEEQQAGIRRQLLERLVDEHLIADFLSSRRVTASPVAIDAQVDLIKSFVRRRGEEPAKLLERLGFSEEQLRETLALPLAWKAYVTSVVSDKKLREEFEAHRRQVDGTKLHARHIVLKVPADAGDDAWTQAEETLVTLRQRIDTGDLSFAEAAQKFSQGPSASDGGAVGFFPFRGTMSAAFADAAFALTPGKLSQPVRTSVGVHLIDVTDEQPGQLSLEDVRNALLDRISQAMWDKQVVASRAKAAIDWRE